MVSRAFYLSVFREDWIVLGNKKRGKKLYPFQQLVDSLSRDTMTHELHKAML